MTTMAFMELSYVTASDVEQVKCRRAHINTYTMGLSQQLSEAVAASFFFFFIVATPSPQHNIYPASNFQVYNAVLSATCTLLCNRSPERTQLTTDPPT